MKPVLLTSFFVLLLAAGLVALSRLLHPATFSENTLILLLAAAMICATLHLWNHD